MKKLMRKLLAVVAAITMVLGMSGLTAFAADGDITVNGAIKDATYKAYKVFNATYSETNVGEETIKNVSYTIPDGSSIAKESGFSTVFTTHENGGVTYVEKNASATEEEVINWLKAHKDAFGQVVREITNNEGASSITLQTGAPGYYYIESTAGDKTAVTIDTAHPTAIVNSKIESHPNVPTDAKKINGKSVNTMEVGEIGTFTLTFYATNYDVDAEGNNTPVEQYVAKDVSNGFDLETATNFGVTVNGQPYAIAGKEVTHSVSTAESGAQVMTITIPWDQTTYSNPSTVVITYKARLTNKTLANRAINTFDVDQVQGHSETHTYNYTVEVTKTDNAAKNAKLLPGAKFVLKNEDKFYRVGDNGIVSWVPTKDEATEVTTGANGKASFQGLKAGNYTLVETEAPAGYTLAENTNFTLNEVTDTNENDIHLTKDITVKDKAGSALPSTGGIGTTIFYVLGAALVIGAGVVLVTRRRLSK